jgi:sugar-specific transcriptional regulator TrmB
MINRELEKLHLSDKESTLYLALLELGEASMEEIVGKSRLKRATAYIVMDELKQRGLVSSTRSGKRKHYVAEDPRTLGRILDAERATYESIIPELLSIANKLAKKPRIRFFEGEAGIKSVYQDTLGYPNQEILMWGSLKAMEKFDPTFLLDYYLEERLRQHIRMRAIGPDVPLVREIQSRDGKELRETRLIAKHETFPFSVEINLYGKRNIGIMSFAEQFGLIIESKEIFDTLKSFFEFQWTTLGK